MSEIEMIEYYREKVSRIQYYIYETQDLVFMDVFENVDGQRYMLSPFSIDAFNKQVKWFDDKQLFQCAELVNEEYSQKRVYLPFGQVTFYEMDNHAHG